MQKKYEEIMRVVDSQMATIDLNKKDIIPDCRAVIHLLKEKLAEMKAFLLTYQFENEADEITFFKHQKPNLLGRLIYFCKILRIESQSPFNTEGLDKYYEKQQENKSYSSIAPYRIFSILPQWEHLSECTLFFTRTTRGCN